MHQQGFIAFEMEIDASDLEEETLFEQMYKILQQSIRLSTILFFILLPALLYREQWSIVTSRPSNRIDASIKFMGQTYALNNWIERKRGINTLLGRGKWIDAWNVQGYEVPYSDPCIEILKYKYGNCYSSLPNQGRKLFWKPDGGFLKPWSSRTMCEMMKGKNLLVVGDSLSEEFFFSLLSSLWASVLVSRDAQQNSSANGFRLKIKHDCENFCYDYYPSCTGPVEILCGELPSFNIGFARTDNLNITDYMWFREIERQNASVLIMNTGAHYDPIEDELKKIDFTYRYLNENYPSLALIYRTSIAGHDDCDSKFISEPLKEVPTKSHTNPLFHWDDIRSRSLQIQTLLER